MAAWTAAARQAARLLTPKSVSTSAQASILVQRRGLAGGGDHRRSPKIKFWQDQLSPSKWKEQHDVRRDRQQSKTNIRYTVRQKRADTKKALKGILFSGGCSASRAESFLKIEADYADWLDKKSRIKPAGQSKRAFQKKLKRKHRRENPSEDFDDNPKKIFYATFGKQGFSWTFRPSAKGFDGTESSGSSNNKFDEQDAKSRTESRQKSFILGTHADRKILGLPTAGPLRIEDVKAAFHLAALKWHPDRHQGSSQVAAEEKFKHCVNAYKSLCSTLSTP